MGKLLCVGAVWGASFIFISLALESYGPMTIAAARVLLAAVVLILLCYPSGQPLSKEGSNWRRFMVVGLFNSALPFYLINWGMQHISSAEAALLLATGTFSAMLLSHLVSVDERINPARAIGVTIGFAGVMVLVVEDLFVLGVGGLKGHFALMAAGISYAISSIMTRRISHLPAISASAGIMLCAGAYLLPLALLFERPLSVSPTQGAIWSMVMLGTVSTALAFVIRYQIIRKNGAVFMSQVGYLVPVFGVLWAWLFLNEPLAIATLVSLAVILVGIAVTRIGSD